MVDTPMLLVTHGWVEWSTARHLVGSACALWLGPTQFHFAALPEVQPPAHRIHAWDSGGRCWRMIPGHDQVLVTQLVRPGDVPPPDLPAIRVTARGSRIESWQAVETGPVPGALPPLERLEITTSGAGTTLATIAFLRATLAAC